MFLAFQIASSKRAIREPDASVMVSSISSVKTKVKGNPREPTGGNAPTELTGIPVDGVIAGAGDTSNGRAWPFKWLLMGTRLGWVRIQVADFTTQGGLTCPQRSSSPSSRLLTDATTPNPARMGVLGEAFDTVGEEAHIFILDLCLKGID